MRAHTPPSAEQWVCADCGYIYDDTLFGGLFFEEQVRAVMCSCAWSISLLRAVNPSCRSRSIVRSACLWPMVLSVWRSRGLYARARTRTQAMHTPTHTHTHARPRGHPRTRTHARTHTHTNTQSTQTKGFKCPQCSGPRRRYAKKVAHTNVLATKLMITRFV